MKFKFSFFFLLIFCKDVFANFELLGYTINAPLYIDKSSIEKTRNGGTIWSLTDYPEIRAINGISFSSRVQLDEFDCVNKLSRMNIVILYQGNMGKGKEAARVSEHSPWEKVVTTNIGYKEFKAVCP
jgi:hypothetical protein